MTKRGIMAKDDWPLCPFCRLVGNRKAGDARAGAGRAAGYGGADRIPQ